MWLFVMTCITTSNPSPEGAGVVSALNARFRAGVPSDDPARAGVVIHALNEQLGVEPSPWLSSDRLSWPPSDRVSASIMNARLPFIYQGGPCTTIVGAKTIVCPQHRMRARPLTPGFVLRPSVVKRALLCAYEHDGGSDKYQCPRNWRAAASPNKCKPGCVSETSPGPHGSVVGLNLSQAMFLHEERVARLSATLPSDEEASSLERARLVIQRQLRPYNELVIAADTYNSLLPGAIEAVYMLPHTTTTDGFIAKVKLWYEHHNETAWPFRSAENEEKLARSVHAQLLRHFNLTAQQLPLLKLNISDRVAPFRLVPHQQHHAASSQR